MIGNKGISERPRRGQPLIMLAVRLSVWVGSRVVMWESPLPGAIELRELVAPVLASREMPSVAAAPDQEPRVSTNLSETYTPSYVPSVAAPLAWNDPVAPPLSAAPHASAGHQLLWMAAMSYLPVPQAVNERLARAVPPGSVVPALPKRSLPGVERWSLDGWALWRAGSGSGAVSEGRAPTYGASQAGAVLRYHLSPSNARDPQAYVRAYRALISGSESELAAGLSARPFSRVPLRAHAELRVTEFADGTRLRPAGFVTTELPAVRLPVGLRGEAYAQAGYVGGEAATPFADEQLHLLRSVSSFDLGEVSVGAAAWGGAQKGAERIDLGPSVRFDLSIGEAPARLSVDYRERVAGEAEPPSGLAVTLSTRF
ncbi:hypothetical protein [Altererythrobacter litoralis]|uniref:Haemolysin activator HlyB C-terminal domain-containing protein n=1 Tax=Altererythrobacter litoralis TaxID=3113904 RepID=A0ABU7GEU3_9SPHN|nr:hypothetical protein [Erythrobacteraceae bacterium 1XM1-14]